jgi:hypothetical protein
MTMKEHLNFTLNDLRLENERDTIHNETVQIDSARIQDIVDGRRRLYLCNCRVLAI